MSQKRARAKRTATPPAIERAPDSRAATIESVANSLTNLQRERERLKLTQLANGDADSDPAISHTGQLMEDDDGAYEEDGKRYLTYAQRIAQVEKARLEICRAFKGDMPDVEALIARNDAQVTEQLHGPVVRRG
jgi:hypothetical protein